MVVGWNPILFSDCRLSLEINVSRDNTRVELAYINYYSILRNLERITKFPWESGVRVIYRLNFD